MDIKSMLKNVTPTSTFEKNVTNCLNLLIAQMHKMKQDLEPKNRTILSLSLFDCYWVSKS